MLGKEVQWLGRAGMGRPTSQTVGALWDRRGTAGPVETACEWMGKRGWYFNLYVSTCI